MNFLSTLKLISTILFCITVLLSSSLYAENKNDEMPTTIDLTYSIKTALQHSYEINKAKEEIERLFAVVGESRALFIPKIDLLGSYAKTDTDRIPSSENLVFGNREDWRVEVRMYETVFAGGRDVAQFNQARALRDAAQYSLETVVNDVLLDVNQKFFAILLAKAKVRVQEQYTTLLEEELHQEEDRLKAGTVSEFNVLRARVAVANSRTPLIQARNQVRIATEELARSIGRHPILESAAPEKSSEALLAVRGELKFKPYTIQADEALNRALKSRPELSQIQSLIKAYKSGVTMVRAGYLPQVDVAGGYAREKSQIGGGTAPDLEGWKLSLESRWNIFDGLATTNRVAQAQSLLNQQQLSYDQEKLNIIVEVRRAYSSFLDSVELINASHQVAHQAEESLRLAQARFNSGVSPQIEVLDSQVALTNARTNEVQALHDYNISIAALERAMGSRISSHDTSTAKTQ